MLGDIMKNKHIYIVLIVVILLFSFVSLYKLRNIYHEVKYNSNEYKGNIPKEEIDDFKGKDEYWLSIPTYDGSREMTHPKVLYFKNGINGYKYWMVMTPYPYNTAEKENPSIVVSNDVTKWIEPKGIKNPVSGLPKAITKGAYFSDPFMLYDYANNDFEMFFRETKSHFDGKYDKNGYNAVYYKSSKDGITWSENRMILEDKVKERYMSISVVKRNNKYKIWYVNYDGNVRYVESNDLESFSDPINIKIDDFNKNVWHGEMQYVEGKYVFIFMIKYGLYYTESNDGINFTKAKLIDTKLDSLNGTINNIYKTSFVMGQDYIELFIPYRINYSWKLYYIKESKKDFYNNLK